MKEPAKIALVLVLAATVFASGCIHADHSNKKPIENDTVDQEQGDLNETTENGDTGPKEPRRIVIQNDRKSFEPDSVEVEKDRNITFVFDRTSGTHSFRIPALPAGTGVLTYEENRSFTVNFDEEGEYSFICSVGTHAEQGMNGTIVVS